MNKEEIKKSLVNTLDALKMAGLQVYDLTQKELLAKTDYHNHKNLVERLKGEGLVNGTIVGKNEALRDAAARTMLASEYAKLDQLEAEMQKVDLELRTAELKYSQLKDIFRVLDSLVRLGE